LNGNMAIGIAPGQASFVYTSDATGCTSDTLHVLVNDLPATMLTGPDVICPGSTTTIEPSVGGSWSVSSDTSITITVDNFGVITGVYEGSATLLFTDASTLCVSLPSDTVFVLSSAMVEMPVDTTCVGVTFNLLSSEDGYWTSSNESVATVDSMTGEVTTISDGLVQFIFTSDVNGCSSSSGYLTVNPPPFDQVEGLSSCVGLQGSIEGEFDGTWESSDTSVLIVDASTSDFTTVSGGEAMLIFTDGNTGCSAAIEIEVFDNPVASFVGEDIICTGSMTSVAPNSGGTWMSEDTDVASVDNLGNVTGISGGSTMLYFIDTNTGCGSNPLSVLVVDNPEVSITGPDVLCVGSETTLSPTSNGLWTSSDTSVAVVDTAGNVTAVGEGMAAFTFSDEQCSATTDSVEVYENLTIEIDTTICEGMDYNGLTESGTYTFDSIDALTGCDILITVELEVLPLSDPLCTVGLDDVSAIAINMYPNPATDVVFIESESKLESVTIYSTDYQKIEIIRLLEGPNTTRILTHALNPGLYIVSIKAEGKLIYKKLIVE